MWEQIHNEIKRLQAAGSYNIRKLEVPTEAGIETQYYFDDKNVDVCLNPMACTIRRTSVQETHFFDPEQQTEAIAKLHEMLGI